MLDSFFQRSLSFLFATRHDGECYMYEDSILPSFGIGRTPFCRVLPVHQSMLMPKNVVRRWLQAQLGKVRKVFILGFSCVSTLHTCSDQLALRCSASESLCSKLHVPKRLGCCGIRGPTSAHSVCRSHLVLALSLCSK